MHPFPPLNIASRARRAISKYFLPDAYYNIITMLTSAARKQHHFVQTTNIKMSQPAAADVRPQRARMENLDILREKLTINADEALLTRSHPQYITINV